MLPTNTLSQEDWQKFIAILETRPDPNDQLLAAFRKYCDPGLAPDKAPDKAR